VLAQTCDDFEIIVVDDGSTDDTLEVSQRLRRTDGRLRVLAGGGNRGAQAARNAGIHAAGAPWVAFLDSDDTWYPDSLALRLAAAESGRAAVVHSACDVRNNVGEVRPFAVPALSGAVYRDLLRAPGPVFPALLVRREALRRLGGLDESLRCWHEWDTAIRLARRHRFAWVATPTFVYNRSHRSTISGDLLAGARGYEHIVRKHRRAILLRCGPRAMAAHHQRVAEYYDEAGDRAAAAAARAAASRWWPETPRRLVRWLRSRAQALLRHR
jgi:glycosyltransferase involved in cell wall biosynthesis